MGRFASRPTGDTRLNGEIESQNSILSKTSESAYLVLSESSGVTCLDARGVLFNFL
jgi:hypothetical protein